MNGAMPGSVFKDGMRLCTKLQIGVNVVCGALILLMVWCTIRRFRKKKPVVEVTTEA
jgi:beta-glucosidase